MSEVRVVLPGDPVAKGRPRFARGRVYTPERTVTYENLLKAQGIIAMRGRRPLTGALEVLVVAAFAIPPSWPSEKRLKARTGQLHHTNKPDADNILKIVGDGLNEIVFEDDKAIVRADVRKIYAAEPCLTVVVRPA
jgi:Holliday junction resolvase RusA-like endonuclease